MKTFYRVARNPNFEYISKPFKLGNRLIKKIKKTENRAFIHVLEYYYLFIKKIIQFY